ncbi:hypothetical protein [Paenibacillus sp. FSL R5-0923]|uniref:hypothetical protein n=1 Tax=Paenibacillus sp. FSL R5-0923 TaxID=2921666 RepID=UPI0030FBB085
MLYYKLIITTDIELIDAHGVDIWMGSHLCEKNQMISSYSSSAIQNNRSFYLRRNVQIVRKDIL